MARAPVSKTGGWGFESLHSCQALAAVRPEQKTAGRHYMSKLLEQDQGIRI
jgi:hypothetical protein